MGVRFLELDDAARATIGEQIEAAARRRVL
jgi:hypothetical protein